jgi:hypothetical protein
VKLRCPVCSESVPILATRRFTSWYGARRQAPCPACGTILWWTPVPWRLMSVLGAALILSQIIPYLVTSAERYRLIMVVPIVFGIIIVRSQLELLPAEPARVDR